MIKCEIYRDSMQNYKRYAIPKAQLIIADVPYNVGNNFYGSNPMWYKGGDNKNGESKLAGMSAFNKLFQFIQWEDDKPTLIKEVLENCVVENIKEEQ